VAIEWWNVVWNTRKDIEARLWEKITSPLNAKNIKSLKEKS
jgi:hypothetical protein